MADRESVLKRLEERVSRISGWLAARQRGGERSGSGDARIEALRREIADVRRAVAETARYDLARVRASLEDLKSDYDSAPPAPPEPLTRAEREALRRHLHTVARVLPDVSNLDSPRWAEAYEEYERSWAEVESAIESKSGTASPASS